jgi:topoisomerase-4 subunit A
VLTTRDGVKTAVCILVRGDSIAVVGENRKMLVFALSNCQKWPEARG